MTTGSATMAWPDKGTVDPQKIHLVFKTHLDIGYTDLAANVKEEYFQRYIPSAIELAKTFRESGRDERYLWTTGS